MDTADQLASRRIDEYAIELGGAHSPTAPQVTIDVGAQPVRGARAGVHEHAVIDELSTVGHVVDSDEAVRSRPRFNYIKLRLIGRETKTVRATQVAGDNGCLTRFPIDPIEVLRQFGRRRGSLVILGTAARVGQWDDLENTH